MAKLTGAKKKAFLERMAKGRKKAARANPKKKKTATAGRGKKKKNTTPRQFAAGLNALHMMGRPAKKKKAKKAKAKKTNPTVRKKRAKKTNPTKRRHLASGPIGVSRKQQKLLLQELRSKGKYRTASEEKTYQELTKKKNPRRRNSGIDEASAMYETFHQRKPGHIVEYAELVNYPGNFAELGHLKELRVFLDAANPKFGFTSFGPCKVVCTPDGSNIYFVDGDQAIDCEALDITTDKDTIELGPCVYICYHTVKGFHDFAPIDYFHHFGEEDGVFPRLGYDRLNKRLYLIGGNYQVKREGIVN